MTYGGCMTYVADFPAYHVGGTEKYIACLTVRDSNALCSPTTNSLLLPSSSKRFPWYPVTMASTLVGLFPFGMTSSVAKSPPDTPTVAQSPLWTFRQPFDPESWPTGMTSRSPAWSSPSEAMESPTDSLSSRQLAAMLQREFDEENDRLDMEHAERLAAAEQRELDEEIYRLDMEHAELLTAAEQHELDEENYRLDIEQAELLAAAEQQHQLVFDCGVCLDKHPEESIAYIVPCGHSFCRECVRGLIVSQIESRRFPVLCPTCTAKPENSRPELIGKVTQDLVLEIGITQEQYDVWTEMEMAEIFVLLQCRRCSRSSYLDREGFNEARNLHCPVDGCNYVWCKECQQEIVPNGPEHSCDGSSELRRLVEDRGWKYCPACNTPCEKINGCDHVSCITPGCRSSFCYRCGGSRTFSSLARVRCQC